MPRQNVYGKRPRAAAAFTTSTVFTWSSPTKPEIKAPSRAKINEEIKILAVGLKSISLEEQCLEVPRLASLETKEKMSRVLKTRDANVEAKPKRSGAKLVDETACPENVKPVVDVCIAEKKIEVDVVKKPTKTESKSKERNHEEEKPQIESLSQTAVSSTELERIAAPKISPPPRRAKAHTSPLPICQRRRKLEASPSPTVPDKPASASAVYTRPLLQLCSDPNGRIAPTPFATWSSNLEPHFHISKIAEASYGEVYRLSLKASKPGFSKSDESVLKIIALKPPPCAARKRTKKEEDRIAMMSFIENVASEVQLLQRMTSIPGFTNFREMRVLQGRPPAPFVAAWKAWNKGRAKSQKSVFPDPSRKASYDEDQLWAVIEMQDAGTDLENVRVDDVWGVWDVFWGVALALGKGEEGARFEHRDLHLGNICVRPTSPDGVIEAPVVRRTERRLGFTGLETTIIDYTLSRAEMAEEMTDASGTDEERVAYLDLEQDEALFEGDGDVEYQYDIYRYMRAAMYLNEPLADLGSRWKEAQRTGRTWKGYHPQTNLLWLHFLLHMLLEQMCWPSADVDAALARLDRREDRMAAWKRAVQLEEALIRLRDLLDLESFQESGLTSVRDLVELALDVEWLDEEDVMGACT